MMNRPMTSLVLALALLVPSAMPANAETPKLQTGGDSLWSRNVSQQEQDAAEEALQAGNVLMKKSAFAKAEAKYRQALNHWDHPGIHYNLALALIQLDRPVEVHAHLVKALQYKEAPLGAEKYAHALLHKESLDKQLAWVEFVCDTPDAVVTAGGQRLPLVNGRYEGLMRSGPVAIKGTRKGYQTREKEFSLAPGKKNTLRFRLYTDGELIDYAPRWSPWKPWMVVGAGAALSAGGGLLYWKARHDYRAFDADVLGCSEESGGRGCSRPNLLSRRNRVEALNRWSFTAMGVGGAALLTGTALVLLNQAEARTIDPEELDRQQGWAVMPVLGGDANGVLVTLQY